MKKRILLSVALLAIAGAVFAQAPTLDKLRFTESTDKTTYFVNPANSQISGAVVIPETYNGKPVSLIQGFRSTGITSISIPNSVYTIGMNAFEGCTGLNSVTIPASVGNLPSAAFKDCTNLTSVTFQGTIRSAAPLANNFPGDLISKWRAGGPGTYTRSRGSDTWTKQGGDGIICPHCGQLIPNAVWR